MPLAGLEPARISPLDFESSASANSATAAFTTSIILPQVERIRKCFFALKSAIIYCMMIVAFVLRKNGTDGRNPYDLQGGSEAGDALY